MRVQPLKRRVDRQHHERQVVVNQAQQDRAVVIEQGIGWEIQPSDNNRC
jgi:hypothetical protein